MQLDLRRMIGLPFLGLLAILASCETPATHSPEGVPSSPGDFIHPDPNLPQYWKYKGQRLLLLGGSDEDNLFQMPNFEQQLDQLKQVGGNYFRNTMSSRDEGNRWPFLQDSTGLFDLRQWDPTYWGRLERFLQATSERDIIVQLEIWATFDFYRENWDKNPFNPKNNRNLNPNRVKLPISVPTHPIFRDNPFFWSIPSQHNNIQLLQYQQAYVDKLLSIALDYPNVLYCMDNETSVTSDWGKFWSNYIHKVAEEQGKSVFTTEMWDPHDLNHISHRETFDHPEIYDFVEISQNNHQKGEAHWRNGLAQLQRLKQSGGIRPVTNVKTYGATGGRHGHGQQNGIESFVRSTLFGASAVRFHRPTSGIGLSDTAQLVIKGVRAVVDKSPRFYLAEPKLDLLKNRTENEAYCRALEGQIYWVYFGLPGKVELDVSALEGESALVEELDILADQWTKSAPVKAAETILLETDRPHTFFVVTAQ